MEFYFNTGLVRKWRKVLDTFCFSALSLVPMLDHAQAPDLGTASTFALFTSGGSFDNFGAATNVTGDAGTHAGAFNAFPTGTLTGTIHVVDPTSAQAAIDLNLAYLYLAGMACGNSIPATLGNDQILTPGVYCTGAASSLTGDLFLDAQGDPDALFILQIDGVLSTGMSTHIILINSAKPGNVYWQVNGAFNLGDNSDFIGTVLGNGAITLFEGATVSGRALTRAGAILLNNNEVGTSPILLPVTLVSFDAEKCCLNTRVNLNWVTASELNSSHFLLERSTDGIHYAVAGQRDAAGNSTAPLSYSFTDETPAPHLNYYRLNQFDLNGAHIYSSEKVVDLSGSSLEVTVYPNPFTEFLSIHLIGLRIEEKYLLQICSNLGTEMHSITLTKEINSLDTSKFPPGIYYYKVLLNDTVIRSGKLISQPRLR